MDNLIRAILICAWGDNYNARGDNCFMIVFQRTLKQKDLGKFESVSFRGKNC